MIITEICYTSIRKGDGLVSASKTSISSQYLSQVICLKRAVLKYNIQSTLLALQNWLIYFKKSMITLKSRKINIPYALAMKLQIHIQSFYVSNQLISQLYNHKPFYEHIFDSKMAGR